MSRSSRIPVDQIRQPTPGLVELAIQQMAPWEADPFLVRELRQKIASYQEFLASPGFRQEYPDCRGVIVVETIFSPPPEIRKLLSQEGIELRPLDEELPPPVSSMAPASSPASSGSFSPPSIRRLAPDPDGVLEAIVIQSKDWEADPFLVRDLRRQIAEAQEFLLSPAFSERYPFVRSKIVLEVAFAPPSEIRAWLDEEEIEFRPLEEEAPPPVEVPPPPPAPAPQASKTSQASKPPQEANGQAAHATAQPAHATAQPAHATSQSAHATAQPAPKTVTPKSSQSSASPTASKPSSKPPASAKAPSPASSATEASKPSKSSSAPPAKAASSAAAPKPVSTSKPPKKAVPASAVDEFDEDALPDEEIMRATVTPDARLGGPQLLASIVSLVLAIGLFVVGMQTSKPASSAPATPTSITSSQVSSHTFPTPQYATLSTKPDRRTFIVYPIFDNKTGKRTDTFVIFASKENPKLWLLAPSPEKSQIVEQIKEEIEDPTQPDQKKYIPVWHPDVTAIRDIPAIKLRSYTGLLVKMQETANGPLLLRLPSEIINLETNPGFLSLRLSIPKDSMVLRIDEMPSSPSASQGLVFYSFAALAALLALIFFLLARRATHQPF